MRAPAIERHAIAPAPEIDIDPPALRARRDAAIAVARMPADPWTLAESIAAPGTDQSAERETEDCGIAEGPQFANQGSADEPLVQTRAASPRYLAAQARIDAALRASVDPLDRAAADFVNVGDLRTLEGAREAVVQQAASSSDPRLVALGYGICHAAPPSPAACPALTAERWAQVDAGNGMPWITVLNEARARNDPAAIRDAMAHLAASTRFNARLLAPVGAIVRRVPSDSPDLAAADDLVTRAIGLAAALPFPAFHPLIELCRNQAGGDVQRAQQCRAISDAMYAHSDSDIVNSISGALLFQLSGDASRRERIRAERTAAAAYWSPPIGPVRCRNLRDEMRKVGRRAEIGDVQAMREAAGKSAAP